jgi:hypothetical protein
VLGSVLCGGQLRNSLSSTVLFRQSNSQFPSAFHRGGVLAFISPAVAYIEIAQKMDMEHSTWGAISGSSNKRLGSPSSSVDPNPDQGSGSSGSDRKRGRVEDNGDRGGDGDGAARNGREVVNLLEERKHLGYDENLVSLGQWGLTRCDLQRPIRQFLPETIEVSKSADSTTKSPTRSRRTEDSVSKSGTVQEPAVLRLPRLPIEAFTNDISCPVCLETYNKTWTVMSCLHRFCSDCFHRSLRMELGSQSNKECPLCRLVPLCSLLCLRCHCIWMVVSGCGWRREEIRGLTRLLIP